YINDCRAVRHQVRPILLIGECGTGVGSRIGGHAHRGGKMRAEYIQYRAIDMTG
ncbi:hypothetical protein DFQ27_006593, partial [Actinomortierella ambigua]